MGLLNGRVSFLRFKVSGGAPRPFGEEELDRLTEYAAGKGRRFVSADGTERGWIAADHDIDFVDEKNIISDCLLFGLRLEVDKLPADRMRAYYAAAVEDRRRRTPTGILGSSQKREAKDAARDRLEKEAANGRFKKEKAIPVLWDRLSNEVLFGATSTARIDHLCTLFER